MVGSDTRRPCPRVSDVRLWLVALLTSMSLAMLGTAGTASPSGAEAAQPGLSRFVAVAPARLLDTRPQPGPTTRERIVVVGRDGIPTDTIAVALTVTATETTGGGFVTVYPAGRSLPVASNINFERPGQTIANTAVVPVGEDGSVEVFSSVPIELVVDITGAFVPSPAAATGRLIAQTPQRLLDTRSSGRLAAGATTSVNVGAGASAAVLNLTATNTTGFGFVSASAGGAPRPLASSLTTDRAGQTIANLAIVPVSADGTVDLYTFSATDLIVDLLGTFTSDTAPTSTDGLFKPSDPRRIIDTRSNQGLARLRRGDEQQITIGEGSAVFLNLTAVESPHEGFATVWPGRRPRPVASNLNTDRSWQTIANSVLSGLGAGGTVNLYSDNGGQFIVDVAGVFTGASLPAETGGPALSPWPPSSAGTLRQVGVVGRDISPKSVTASGTGLVFAQNMMYSHTITVYDRFGRLVRTIDDSVNGIRGAPVEAAAHPNGRWMYVSNYSTYGPGQGPEGFDACSPRSPVGESTVYRVDLGTLGIDQVIPVGRVPKYLTVSPDGKWLAVTNWCSWDLSIIEVATGREVRRSPVLGRYPRGVVIDPASSTAYVALMGQGEVVAVSLATGQVTRRITRVGGGPRHLNLSPDGSTLYVTLNEDGGVARLDVPSGQVTARVATGEQPRSAALSADGRSLFVVNYESATASKIRTDTMTVEQDVSTSYHPIGITYDDESRQLWVACYVGRIHIFENT